MSSYLGIHTKSNPVKVIEFDENCISELAKSIRLWIDKEDHDYLEILDVKYSHVLAVDNTNDPIEFYNALVFYKTRYKGEVVSG